jgi:sulfite reductase (ferredoxin)
MTRDDLSTLGIGVGSENEQTKARSEYLRGSLAADLLSESPILSDENAQLLKFHGSYQQDDRDERRSRRLAGKEKAYEFMVRSRIPGGQLTAEQYLTHDAIASRYGNETIRLTTRQGIQLHGILKGDLKPTIQSINETLLSTLAACGDVNRNVMACPVPTLDYREPRVEEYAHRLASHLTPRTRAYHEIWLDGEKVQGLENEPIYGPTYLPRKFKIAIARPRDNCVDVFTNDIGFIAEIDEHVLRGFTVVVGGGIGSTHGKPTTFARLATPLCFVAPADVVPLAEAIVTIHRDFGDRQNRKHARLKYVVEELGVAWIREEVERRLGHSVADPHDVRLDETTDHLGWHQQGNGLWFLGLHIPSGRIADTGSSHLRQALRQVVTEFEPDLRITGQQNLLLTNLHGGHRVMIESTLRENGVEFNPSRLGLKRHALACPALPTCGLAVAEAERALPGIIEAIGLELEALGLKNEPLSIRVTGCPNGCARPRMGDIGIVGRSFDLYDVFVGGDNANTRLNTILTERVKRNEIAATLRPHFLRWKHGREINESFGNFVHRVGNRTSMKCG